LIKRKIEDVFIFPLILLGRLIALIRPQRGEYRVYFFFPFYHIGGAEKVHAQITQVAGGKDCIIYFTKKSHTAHLLDEFKKSGCVIKDVSAFTDNKWLYFINLTWRGLLSGYINRQRNRPVVFNGQCNFGYKLSPWVRKDITQIELIHSLNTFSFIRIPFLPFITTTVMISRKRIEDHAGLYDKVGIPSHYLGRIKYIPNAIALPDHRIVTEKKEFVVLYVGRGGVEKRLHLVAAIAKQVTQQDPSIKFEILGDVSGILTPGEHPYILFHGNQSDNAIIRHIYQKASLLLLTSDTEGFPMVVIEAMAHGLAVIATPVGDIPLHLQQGVNGFLFSEVQDEQRIITEGTAWILRLKADRNLLHTISQANIQYASHNFGIENFRAHYRQLTGHQKHELETT
jgi:glycosyltransferase involved in cell wall biosynthesis